MGNAKGQLCDSYHTPNAIFVTQLALMMQTLVTYWYTCETQLYTLGFDIKRCSS